MSRDSRATAWPYDEQGEPGDFYYSRFDHPSGAAAEAQLGALEGGTALLYASGMGAATCVLLALAAPGRSVALAEGAYYGTSLLLADLARWGLEFSEFDQTGPPPDSAEIIWVEAPANPLLTLPDWDAITEHKRQHGSVVVCDATIATPVYLQALDQGADVTVHSATKYLTGGRNALLGATVTRDAALAAELRMLRGRAGIPAAPEAADALIETLPSLESRMRQHTNSAAQIAERLRAHSAVSEVRYPGFSGLICFEVAEPRLVEISTDLIVNATSLGGTVSSMESRHRWEGERVPEGLLRLSVGLEDVDEIWADLSLALDRSAANET